MISKIKKVTKITIIVAFIFVLGGVGGVVFNKYLLPKLSTNSFFSKCSIFQKANENVTVINKTEQIVTYEERPIEEVASRASKSLVSIVSASEKGENKTTIGVVISSDGLIMTYNDLILGDQVSYVVFDHKGNSHVASLVASDEYSNLVFLKTDASNLNAIPFSDSEELKIGDKLIALGSFLGKPDRSFGIGFVEGFNGSFNLAGKALSYSDKLEGVLETSFDEQEYVGGPIINYDGEMVGFTGKIVMDNRDYYFQIPSNDIEEVVEKVFEGNVLERAKLGVYYIPLSKINALVLGQDRTEGALVYSPSNRQSMAVISRSAGEKAGIRIGDVIVSVNGERIDWKNPLSKYVAKYKKGDKVEMVIFRNRQEISLEVQF